MSERTGIFFVAGVNADANGLKRLVEIYKQRAVFDAVGLHMPNWSRDEGLVEKSRQLKDAFDKFKKRGDISPDRILVAGISAGFPLSAFASIYWVGAFDDSVRFAAICSRVRTKPPTKDNWELFARNPDYHQSVRYFQSLQYKLRAEIGKRTLILASNKDWIAPKGSYETPGARIEILEDTSSAYAGHDRSIGRILSFKGRAMRDFLMS